MYLKPIHQIVTRILCHGARAGAGAGRGRCCGAARISNRYVREFVAECLGTKKGLGII